MLILNEDADKILKAPTARVAKQIATSAVKNDVDLHIWHTCSLEVMAGILHAKATSNESFKEALISSKDSILVEATQDLFWGAGLTPVQIQHTKPRFLKDLITWGTY